MKLLTHPQSRVIRDNAALRLNDMTLVHPSDAWLIADPHWEEVIIRSATPPHVRKSSDGYTRVPSKARLDDAFTEPSFSDLLRILVAQEWLLTLLTSLLPYSQLLGIAWSYGTPYSQENALFGFVCGLLPLAVHSTRALPFSTVWLLCK